MTREEAIKNVKEHCYFANLIPQAKEALDMAIKALEQEPRKDEVILTKEEYGELVSSEFDNGYAKGYREALEQEPIEVEATKLQMAYNQGFEDCRKVVMDLLNEAGKLSLLAMVADLQSVNPQEPKIGHWTHDGSHWKNRFICSECNNKLYDEPTNYCPNCGCRMVEPQESEDKE